MSDPLKGYAMWWCLITLDDSMKHSLIMREISDTIFAMGVAKYLIGIEADSHSNAYRYTFDMKGLKACITLDESLKNIHGVDRINFGV